MTPEYYIRIEWDRGYLELKYSELLRMSIRRRSKILTLAKKCGGWKLICKGGNTGNEK